MRLLLGHPPGRSLTHSLTRSLAPFIPQPSPWNRDPAQEDLLGLSPDGLLLACSPSRPCTVTLVAVRSRWSEAQEQPHARLRPSTTPGPLFRANRVHSVWGFSCQWLCPFCPHGFHVLDCQQCGGSRPRRAAWRRNGAGVGLSSLEGSRADSAVVVEQSRDPAPRQEAGEWVVASSGRVPGQTHSCSQRSGREDWTREGPWKCFLNRTSCLGAQL